MILGDSPPVRSSYETINVLLSGNGLVHRLPYRGSDFWELNTQVDTFRQFDKLYGTDVIGC